MSDLFKFVPIEETFQVKKAKSKYAKKSAFRYVTETVALVSHRYPAYVPRYPLEELRLRAIESYNWIQGCKKTGRLASTSGPDVFFVRLEVNFLRHEKSYYDKVMNELNGRRGADEGRLQLRYMILLRIAEVYPHLHEECLGQWKIALERYYRPC